MPIRGKREMICRRCGKRFTVECGDNIKINDAEKLSNALCLKCKMIKIITGK